MSDSIPNQCATRGQLIAAALLAVALMALIAVRTWSDLSLGRLPDTDDMMRLAQVRDWIAGQPFADMVQHRVAPPFGGSMHWSRIGDMGIAAIIVALRPIVGGHAAEIAATVAYPALLFAGYAMLTARLAARLIGRDGVISAVVLALVAFPAFGLFVPGRIDHHGLQILLMLGLLAALIARPSAVTGSAAGAAMAVSFAIGLETAPQMFAGMAILFAFWALDGEAEAPRTKGFAAALLGLTACFTVVLRPTIWSMRWCDSFGPATSDAILIAASIWIVLSFATPKLRSPAARLAVGIPLAAAGAIGAAVREPICLTGPYGQVDPLLMRLWISKINEARGLFAQSVIGDPVAIGGLTFVALCACLAILAVERSQRRAWLCVAAMLGVSFAVAIVQIRANYIGSAFAALPMAYWLVRIRRRVAGRPLGAVMLLPIWIVGAGVTYPIIGMALADTFEHGAGLAASAKGQGDCKDAKAFARFAKARPGIVIAPVDLGAFLVGMTPHAVLAAPYHRNNVGNLAMYRFFLSRPPQAHAIAARWRADYVVFCPGSFAEVDLAVEGPGGMAQLLRANRPPAWLEPIEQAPTGLRVYRIR